MSGTRQSFVVRPLVIVPVRAAPGAAARATPYRDLAPLLEQFRNRCVRFARVVRAFSRTPSRAVLCAAWVVRPAYRARRKSEGFGRGERGATTPAHAKVACAGDPGLKRRTTRAGGYTNPGTALACTKASCASWHVVMCPAPAEILSAQFSPFHIRGVSTAAIGGAGWLCTASFDLFRNRRGLFCMLR